ncbi:hypothetical protein [Halobellus ruber]|uniref:Glycosyltransferase RgtA/B/C/D-like domain-containing protein n=1 Tax=Halobellus ruber TaxID=2761102 RepID=A0A7J9SJR5_9EURY|nr:hypothetical protein [Halobellus ruber]MBB6646623.1 hypothetical protein [Halobellus ruber]
MAEAISSQSGVLPVRIDGYTTNGIPFAYPPLAFYLIEFLAWIGIDRVQVLRVGAPSLVLLFVAMMYYFTYTMFGSYRSAAVAGIVVGTHVHFVRWLIGGVGFVRGLGFVFALLGLTGGYLCFRQAITVRNLSIAIVGWGLAVLTHPVYAAVAGIGVFSAWLLWDRSARGFGYGAAIAAAGLAVASPWWGTVISRHGVEVFVTGASAHSSFTSNVSDVVGLSRSFWISGNILDWPRVMTLIGGVVLAVRGDWRHVLWLLIPIAMLVPPHPRLWLIAIAPLSAIGVVTTAELIATTTGDIRGSPLPSFVTNNSQRVIVIGIVALLVIPFVAGNALAASQLPVHIDDDDQRAMTWMNEETDPDAGAVAIGITNEWLPYLSDRTSVVTPYGTEWVDPGVWDRHLVVQNQLVQCPTASCIDSVLEDSGFAEDTDYVYIQTEGTYAVSPTTNATLAESPRFDAVYANSGAVVYEYRPTSA